MVLGGVGSLFMLMLGSWMGWVTKSLLKRRRDCDAAHTEIREIKKNGNGH